MLTSQSGSSLKQRAVATCDEPVKVHFNESVLRRGMTTANTGTDGLYFAINLQQKSCLDIVRGLHFLVALFNSKGAPCRSTR